MSEAAVAVEEQQPIEVEPVTPEEPAEPEAEAPVEAAAEEQPAEAEPEQTPEQKAEAEEKHKRAGGWKRKLERQERELQMLREELARRAQPEKPEPEKTEAQKAADYIDSLVQKRLAAEREAQRAAQVQAEFQQRALSVKKLHPDFDEVVMSADVPVSAAVSEALLTSEHGPAIMYRLASNPDELARISALPPLAAAREIGRLEAQAASSTAAPRNPVTVTRKSAAPAPVAPVAARGPTRVKRPEDMTQEEYNAWRDSQRNR